MDKPLHYSFESQWLVSELEKAFPEQSAQPTDTLPQIYFQGGQRDVVRWIKNTLEEHERS